MTVIHDAKGPADELSIVNIEKKLGITFPNDYREFLKKYNGGYPEPDGFYFIDSKDGSCVDKFLSTNGDKSDSIAACYDLYKKRIPQGFVPIATDPGGNLLLLCGTKENSGIFFWDHEEEVADGEQPDMR
ncbi:SMI1/KNR4 family protein, partial [Yersinia wautersii]